jgi:hypothetical protein
VKVPVQKPPFPGPTNASHKVEVYFRAADLGANRWTGSMAHLRVVGLSLDATGALDAYPRRPKTAICYGDSITEGVGVDGKFTSWQILAPNNARGAWPGLVCSALDCEYGQIGSGGQGLVTPYNVPGCVTAWDHYDADTPRLVHGALVPEPDYFFCACPHTQIFCVVPPAGIHRSEITAAVNARNQAGDVVSPFFTPAITPPSPRHLLLAGPTPSRDQRREPKTAPAAPSCPSATVTVLAFAGFFNALSRTACCLPHQ